MTKFCVTLALVAGVAAGLAGTSAASPQYAGFVSPEACEQAKAQANLGLASSTCIAYYDPKAKATRWQFA